LIERFFAEKFYFIKFFNEKNMSRLRESIAQAEAGNLKKHDLIEE